MAKLAYSKLKLKTDTDTVVLNFNDQEIEISRYLPIEQKIELIENIVNNSCDDNGYYNPVRLGVYRAVGIVEAYTNLSFTEKQKEDIYKLYDQLVSSGLYIQIISAIPAEEEYIHQKALKTIENVYAYRNSAMGILAAITRDYSNMQWDVDKIKQQLQEAEGLELVKDIMTNLG